MNRFRIELLSDLCVSNGESFGSIIDTDICYDRFGIPVIHGKSLKGCLRECAEELADCGVLPSDFTDKVFGTAGNSEGGLLCINDAHPEKYSQWAEELSGSSVHPYKVTGLFTYVRTQTSIDDKTGTAKENSLRSTRVLKQGVMTFVCGYELPESYREDFEKCIKILRHIGMNRSRGFGEVRCVPMSSTEDAKADDFKPLAEGDMLVYTIRTLSPVIPVKNDEDICYIPGSTIEGLCFRRLGREKMSKILESGAVFTNALISDGKERFASNPAFLAKQKEADFEKDGLDVFVFDTEKCENAFPPAMAIKNMNTAVNNDFSCLKAISAEKEINYHHRQSQDNPGIVDGKNFYQLSSLSAGQIFMGYIYGDKNSLDEIYRGLGTTLETNIGHYRSGGYGHCVIELAPGKREITKIKSAEIAVCLKSPVIIYDDHGMPCAKKEVFESYLTECLGGAKLKLTHCYLKYTSVGGYNVTWNMNKQHITVFGAGSVFVYIIDSIDEKPDIPDTLFIGERTSEGFGEAEVFDYENIVRRADSGIKIQRADISGTGNIEADGELSAKLKENDIKIKLQEQAAKQALNVDLNSAQVDRLIRMCVANDNYDGFAVAVDAIAKASKKDDAKKFTDIEHVKNIGLSEDDLKKNKQYYKIYMLTLLTHAKYLLRSKKEK